MWQLQRERLGHRRSDLRSAKGHVPAEGDVQLGVSVNSNGFRGHSAVRVSAEAAEGFLRALAELCESRSHVATLESVGTPQLRIALERSEPDDPRSDIRATGYLARNATVFSRSLEARIEFAIRVLPE